MNAIEIRPLRPEDKEAWLVLWQGYLTFYEQELAPEITEDLFARLLSGKGHNALVAVSGGVPVGLVHYLFHDSSWSTRSVCYLEDLYVSEDLRLSGAGRKLIEAVYAAADAEPTANGEVYWQTKQDNARARQLYDRVGVLSEFIRYDRP
ncbi:GNAT family N-acetyltransferase [Roseibium sp. M-1]